MLTVRQYFSSSQRTAVIMKFIRECKIDISLPLPTHDSTPKKVQT